MARSTWELRRLRGPAALGIAICLQTAAILAQPPATEPAAALVARLGSERFDVRQQATEDLARLGPAARDDLQRAAADGDPEVRLRAKELLRRLAVEELWQAGRVRYVETPKLASAALGLLGEQTGNRLLLGDQYGAFQDRDVQLDAAEGDFWPVLDEVCRQTQSRVRPHYDTRQPGLVVVSGTAARYPVAYSGPLRAQITSARRVFTEELDYEDLGSDRSHTFQINLQMTWEERFRLVAYRSQPELVLARTVTGQELSASQPASTGWNVAGSGTRQLTMNLRLHPPATSASHLDTLHLKWGLIAVGDLARLEITELSSPEPHFQDDVELAVETYEVGPGPRCELTLSLIRDLVVPDPQEVLFQESEIELLDQEGRPLRKQGQTNSVTEHGAKIKLTFLGDHPESVPTKLRFTYPRIRSQREVAIIFRNVPLPTARPE